MRIALVSVTALLALSVFSSTAFAGGPMHANAQIVPGQHHQMLIRLHVFSDVMEFPQGGSVTIAPCKLGQQKFSLAYNTRHLSNGESLRPYRNGPGWVYEFPALTGQAYHPLTLTVPISLLKGEGADPAPPFCAQVWASDFALLPPTPAP